MSFCVKKCEKPAEIRKLAENKDWIRVKTEDTGKIEKNLKNSEKILAKIILGVIMIIE